MSINGLRIGGQHRSPLTTRDKLALTFWLTLVVGCITMLILLAIGAL